MNVPTRVCRSIQPPLRMPLTPRLLAMVCLLVAVGSSAAADGNAAADGESIGSVGQRIASTVAVDVSLPAAAGGAVELKVPFAGRLRVVCFLGCECPVAKLYASRLAELAKTFAEDAVEFIGVNSNPQDSLAKLAGFAHDHQVEFPLLKDHDGEVARRFGATRTPEVFVIDPLGQVLYQGRIDDQYRPGVVTDEPLRDDLRLAIEESLRGEPVSVPLTTAAGCLIAKRRDVTAAAPVTFANQVARILDQHCVECHRPGEIGPFSLTDYDEVVGWADMILEVIDQRRMPPWHADERHGHFANSRQMPEQDRKTLHRWVEYGTPFGDADDLPSRPEFASGWQLPGEPDRVLPMAAEPFTVAAEGTIDYQYFVVDPGFTEDRWIKAAEVVPGNRSVVHHGIVFIRPPDGVRLEGLNWLTAYVPGQRLIPPSDRLARRVPAGSKLVFQMHYTPTGKIETDLSQLGLLFADADEVTDELVTLVGIEQELEIAPGDPAATVQGQTSRFPTGSRLLAISPHMHLRGKSFRVEAAGGEVDRSRVLLSVPEYDFNWQHTYILASPLPLDHVESLDFTATFDNSADNPFNPDPTEFVSWGDQTWEEMAIVFYEVAKPLRPTAANPPAAPAVAPGTSPPIDDRQSRLAAEADRFFDDLDRDGDGLIRYDEVDRAVQLRLFRTIDSNSDRVIDRDELLDYLQRNR